MLSIRNMSFKGKMLLYAASATGTALALAFIAVMVTEWFEWREEIPRDLGIQAEVVGQNATAALAFEDRKSAEEILAGLKADDNVILACICSRDGSEFAKYVRAGSETATEEEVGPGGHRFSANRFHIRRPIVLDGEKVGFIYLQYDLQQCYADLKQHAAAMSLGMLLALTGAFLVSFRVQRMLTRPVTELARTARTIAENKDYSVRAVKRTKDELGTLTDAFNDMLLRIQERDTALRQSHDTLERRVKERTMELANANEGLQREITERTWAEEALRESNKDLRELNERLASTADELKGLMKSVTEDKAFSVRFVNRRLVWCWEAKNCKHEACPAYGRQDTLRCWEVVGTLCGGVVQGKFAQKLKDCRKCEVYQRARGDYISDLGETFNDMIAILEERQQALEEALKAAESATQTKSEFLANMSHEIRTPMTAILGFADVILEQGDLTKAPPERIEAARTIKRNGEYLVGIINDILDLSKIEAGKMTVERIACSPHQIVDEVASLIRVPAEAKGLPIEIEYVGAVPETIQTDPTRLRQILINVVGNAVKFTDYGSIRLIVRLVEGTRIQGAKDSRGRGAEDLRIQGDEGPSAATGSTLESSDPRTLGPYLQFDVADTGRGMAEEQVAQLFQPFTQADTSATRKSGGTGLGLSISKRLAEMLGGDVTVVETQVRMGTRFRITVATGPLEGVRMLDAPSTAVAKETDAPKIAAGAGQPELHGFRILLAEDGPDNQRLIVFVLQKAGAEVTVVENGRLAAESALAARAEGNSFDVILMDMQMPVMDGYEAARLLRKKGYTNAIVALTAHAMKDDREKCINAGCDDYTTKPIDRKKLIEVIQAQPCPAPA